MNIVFQKMIVDNFMSFDHEEFNFEENAGITLITGINNDIPGSKNGCGKSALINGFVFALFGKMLNQMTIKNVSNRYVPVRNTEVILEMKVDEVRIELFNIEFFETTTEFDKISKLMKAWI